jgi:hypothetical protein
MKINSFVISTIATTITTAGVFGTFLSPPAFAWGRHDLITELSVSSREFAFLNSVSVIPEPIEKAAPDLLKRVVPILEQWAKRYHEEHDTRYAWSIPEPLERGSAREKLLWALEDNMKTPLDLGKPGAEKNAAQVLTLYANEPDGLMDSGLDQPPYVQRVGESMSFFRCNDSHGSGFRHYLIPDSMLPPIWSPKGIAPYRAGLYAELAEGAFATGHPYWGYRFLAWSLHYVQDLTQPWHTVFLPGFSFLSFSKVKMKKEVSALHYLTEGLADSWMFQALGNSGAKPIPLPIPIPLLIPIPPTRHLASLDPDPWYVSELSEQLASQAHEKALNMAKLARSFFQPLVDQLGDDLKPSATTITLGGIKLQSSELDFSGDILTHDFYAPLWKVEFTLGQKRDQLVRVIADQLHAAIGGSRLVIARVLSLESTLPPA